MNVPVLRFPEFREAEEWERDKLVNLIDTVTPPLKLPTALYQAGGLFPIIDQSQSYICGWTNDKDALITDDLPLIIFGDHTCALKIVNMPFAQGADGIKILKTKGKTETSYLYQYLLFNPVVMEEYKRHFSILKGKFVAFPKIETGEQQKIAACLSSLDELITAQAQKVEALKTHKKGLMQQLFPAEGETVPKLRFPEFREAGEWEEKPLGKVAEIITGNTPSTLDSSNYGGNRMFVSPADISDGRYIINTKTTLSELGYSRTRQIPADSILFVCIGSTIGKVAQNKFDCATNQQINALIPFENFSSGFIYFALDNDSSKIAQLAGKQAVPIINKSLFSSVLVRFPSPKEQQKIAACLSSLDELIAAQSQKVEALLTHKKGLMQQLFPAVDEVNA